jgi:HD-GYP domain-containing protein (c-di-GMP phosphodiesterase class II)
MSSDCLVALTGPLQGKQFPINGSLSIGRNPENQLQLDDLQVSRTHALIEQSDKGTILRDLNSGNGTYVGDRRVLEYKLSSGDIIRIGMQQLRFEGGEPGVKQPPEDSGVRFESNQNARFEAAKVQNVYQTFFQAPRNSVTEDELQQTRKRLEAVYAANQIIASEPNLLTIFERLINQVFSLIPAHNGVLLLKDRQSGELVTEYVKSGLKNEAIKISSSIVKRAMENGEAVITYDAAEDARFDAGVSIISQNIASAMCVPLQHQDECLGVLYVDTRGTTNAFVQKDLELLAALAGPAAIAIKNAQYVTMLERAYDETLTALANAIELRDHYTVGHTWRVTNFALEIAEEMGWTPEKLKEMRMGGVLHDIGKIAIDDAILRKPGHLTDEEYAKMKIHPERGARLLADVSFLQPLIPYCLYHHERFDGKGYPYGLAGDKIPIEGRIVAVADCLDALTSNRPYRKGLAPDVAKEEIVKGSGTQFDPEVVEAFVRCYESGRIQRILQDYYKNKDKSIACPFCSTFIVCAEPAKNGDEVSCSVCHRRMRIEEKNEAWYGVLLPQSGGCEVPTPRQFSRSG